MSGFDRVARAYRWLEYLAFGRSLSRARTVFLPALVGCRDILVVGDGDGRFVEALAAVAPTSRIHSIDTSPAMLQLATHRVRRAGHTHVTFECADVRSYAPGHHAWDAVVTMFVLDCLTDEDVRLVAGVLSRALRHTGVWLYADFAIPERGWRRVRARLWIELLYRFFRWQAKLPVAQLPPSERLIIEAGLVPLQQAAHQAGMVRTILFGRLDETVATRALGLSTPRSSLSAGDRTCR